MPRIATSVVIIISLPAFVAALAAAPPAPNKEDSAAAAGEILNIDSYWRWHVTYSKPNILVDSPNAQGATSAPEPRLIPKGATDFLVGDPPPAAWLTTDFGDADWPRARGTWLAGLPFAQFSSAMVCMRGKFTVNDPAAVNALFLSLKYVGGAAVYLNGKEVWRGDLPAGPLTPRTRAIPYPAEAYVGPDGKVTPSAYDRTKKPEAERKELEDRVAGRARASGSLKLPAAGLVKGANVLAIELHRSDYHPVTLKAWFTGMGYSEVITQSRVMWPHVNLLDARLRAEGAGVTANVARPEGFHVWNQDIHERVVSGDYGDPNEPVTPIRLCGARNGSFCGQVVLGGADAIKGARAAASDLKAAKGDGIIPAANVTVLYGVLAPGERDRKRWFDGLTASAPDAMPANGGVANLPIFVRVRVPKDALAGDYTGRLTVSADGVGPTVVPIELNVADWIVPDPKDYRTFVGIYQSPTSLARHYKMTEWSEEHWRAVDQAFALLGRAGNKLINVPLLEHTQFGNEGGMVYWIAKPDGGYDYDFTVFDRFVAMAKKHCGTLDHVALHVWHSGGWETRKADQEATVTVADPATGKQTSMQVPVYGTEASKKFWKPVLEACWNHLVKAGLDKAMCIGILSDGTAPKEVFKAFDEIWPGLPTGGPSKWTRGLHSSDAHPKPYEVLKGGAQVVLHEYCYGYGLADPEKPLPPIWNLREMPGTSFRRVGGQEVAPLLWYKTFPEQSLFCKTKGIGRICLDFWPVLGDGRGRGPTTTNLYNRFPYSSCAQRAPSLMSMTWAGPTGPETTVRYEMLCQGVQDAEADIVVSDALSNHADKLGKELADQCRQTLVDRLWYMRSRDQSAYETFMPRCNHYGWRDLDRRIYQCAAQIARELGPGN